MIQIFGFNGTLIYLTWWFSRYRFMALKRPYLLWNFNWCTLCRLHKGYFLLIPYLVTAVAASLGITLICHSTFGIGCKPLFSFFKYRSQDQCYYEVYTTIVYLLDKNCNFTVDWSVLLQKDMVYSGISQCFLCTHNELHTVSCIGFRCIFT
jgi:hypothetical protein